MIGPMRHLVVLLSIACGSRPTPSLPTDTPGPKYRAEIIRTSFGVPHVRADDLPSVFFGQGYAFAEDHVCILADQIVKIRSQRARWFGRGDDDANVNGDFGWLALGVVERARESLPALSPEVRAATAAFAAGHNAWLERHPGDLPPDCAGEPWVGAITEVDLLAYNLSLMLVASSGFFVDQIGSAAPSRAPRTGAAWPAPPVGASNAWGLGGDRTVSGGGMLLANPHYPWEGAMKFTEVHLTVPGQLDVYGVAPLGAPGVVIGFNGDVAWTFTYSASSRFTLYRLALDREDATRYVHGGASRPMLAREHAIDVREADGSIARVTRTLWATHHGPMIAGGPFGWGPPGGTAWALRDANLDNRGFGAEMLAILRARDVPSLVDALREHSAIPFLNIVAVDRHGDAFYADGSQVPDLSAEALAKWSLGLLVVPELKRAWKRGMVILDGSDPTFDWDHAVPFAHAPQLRRRDYVLNANDNAWLAHATVRLTGHSRLYGDVETPRSARTRMNLTMLLDSAGEDGKYTLDELSRAILSNRSLLAELLLADVVARCDPKTPACRALARWDGVYDLDRVGAIVWRELIGELGYEATLDAGPLFATPFDPSTPLATPRGLAPAPKGGPDPIRAALDRAAKRLADAGLDAEKTTLGDAQLTRKGERRIPIHGATHEEGGAHVVGWSTGLNLTRYPPMRRGEVVHHATDLTTDGYVVNYGTSFLLVVEMTDDGPRGQALLTYSQSSDPRSPHHADQTEAFSKKQWRPVRYRAADVDADAKRREIVEGP